MTSFLTINGYAVPVSINASSEVDYQEVGGEVVRAYAGNLLSSVKATARVWKVVTVPVEVAEADYMMTMLRSPSASLCEGRFIGGSVLAMVRSLRKLAVATAHGTRWVVEFELHESATLALDGNLLRNPGFEEGGAWWPEDPRISYLQDPDIAHSGSGYAEAVTTSTTNFVHMVDLPAHAGDVADLGAQIQTLAGSAHVRLYAYDGSGGIITNYPTPAVTTPAWTPSARTSTVLPPGTAFVRFVLRMTDAATARFDDVYLRIRRGS